MLIQEILTEAITLIATHHGATIEQTMEAFLGDIGSVRSDIMGLYFESIALLRNS